MSEDSVIRALEHYIKEMTTEGESYKDIVLCIKGILSKSETDKDLAINLYQGV